MTSGSGCMACSRPGWRSCCWGGRVCVWASLLIVGRGWRRGEGSNPAAAARGSRGSPETGSARLGGAREGVEVEGLGRADVGAEDAVGVGEHALVLVLALGGRAVRRDDEAEPAHVAVEGGGVDADVAREAGQDHGFGADVPQE